MDLDILKQYYDISFKYMNTTSGLTQNTDWSEKRIESRLCTQDDFGWNDQ